VFALESSSFRRYDFAVREKFFPTQREEYFRLSDWVAVKISSLFRPEKGGLP
jgi:hypothetical protein